MKIDRDGDWLNSKGQKIKWLNEKEGKIIGGYLKFIDENKNNNLHQIEFSDGTLLLIELNNYGESDNELELKDENYEELYEFYLTVKKILRKGTKLNYKKNEKICLDYRNFPISYEIYEG